WADSLTAAAVAGSALGDPAFLPSGLGLMAGAAFRGDEFVFGGSFSPAATARHIAARPRSPPQPPGIKNRASRMVCSLSGPAVLARRRDSLKCLQDFPRSGD